MGNELSLFGGEEHEALVPRRGYAERKVMRRAEANFAALVTSGKHEEVKAMLRKRLTEDAAQDITDVAQLAQQLAGNDQWVASLLIPLVQEYARTTTRDIKDFGRGW
ncbi:broad-specificity NMP kinase [Streptomyces aurantiacus]|uniref:hypothetical protein n=1 Tax=Streptomyces aurantiacus TaxID=47760 RepID=UPI00278FD1F5|nr:hypothetical protein [Streptomyces aurantiacus]MDQ0776328.1 broad-specificity NMP kinase [Streptomyces aurantiacus]